MKPSVPILCGFYFKINRRFSENAIFPNGKNRVFVCGNPSVTGGNDVILEESCSNPARLD
jgi:hypothetical protein